MPNITLRKQTKTTTLYHSLISQFIKKMWTITWTEIKIVIEWQGWDRLTRRSICQFSCKSWACVWPSSSRLGEDRCRGPPAWPLFDLPGGWESHLRGHAALGPSRYLFGVKTTATVLCGSFSHTGSHTWFFLLMEWGSTFADSIIYVALTPATSHFSHFICNGFSVIA